jgi:IstB-like ATP binding protein
MVLTMTDRKLPFWDLVADLENTGSILSKEQVEATVARNARQERLDRNQISKCITEADAKRIISGDLDENRALVIVRRWLDPKSPPALNLAGNPTKFLMLLGEKGLGKTVAAAWAIAEYGGYYLSGPGLRALAESTHWGDRDRRENVLNARLVVLDDMGTEDLTGPTMSYFNQLINERQGARFMTLITGNIKAGDLEERYDERAADRIIHQGTIFELTGDSLRQVKPGLRAV